MHVRRHHATGTLDTRASRAPLVKKDAMPPSTTPDRAVTAARNATLAVFGLCGLVTASWVSRIPDIREALSLSPSELSHLILAISLGSVLGLPTAGRIVQRIGLSRAVVLAGALCLPALCVCAVLITARLDRVWLLPFLLCYGIGFGIWDVAQNIEGSLVERRIGRSIMPWFHAAFSGGTVLGALVGAGLVWLGVSVAVHIVATCVLAAVLLLLCLPAFVAEPTERTPPAAPDSDGTREPGPARSRSAWTEPRTLLIGVMALAASFTEGTANDWIAVAFVDGFGLPNAVGVIATAVFLTFMTAGRMLGTSLLDRYGRVLVLRCLFASTILGCVMVVFGTAPVAFLGAAIWGLGASLGFPVGMSAAADDPSRAAARISVVSTIGYLAFLGGPVLLGYLGDHVGVLRALLLVGAVSALAMFAVPAAREPRRPGAAVSPR